MKEITKITTALAHAIAERKEAATKEKALKDELIKLMKEDGKDVEATEAGKFSIARRASYKYPEDIMKQEEELKLAKVDAVEQGRATQVVSEYILFKENEDE